MRKKGRGGTPKNEAYLKSLPQFCNVLRRLLVDVVGNVSELVLNERVPPRNALVNSDARGVILSTLTASVVLEDEILTNHPRPIPNKLVHVQRVRSAVTSIVETLPIPLHHVLFNVGRGTL